MEYHYQWTDCNDSTYQETKKWNDSLWSRSPTSQPCNEITPRLSSRVFPRCATRMRSIRRRRLLHPPFNYFPRAPRPQWPPNVQNYDYKWNQGGTPAESFQQYSYNHEYSCHPDSLDENRPCVPKVHPKILVKSPEMKLVPYGPPAGQGDFFPPKRMEADPWSECVYSNEYYSNPLAVDSPYMSDFRNYVQVTSANNNALTYTPPVPSGESGQYYANKAPSPVSGKNRRTKYLSQSEAFQRFANGKGIHTTPGFNDKLSAIIEETIGESSREQPHSSDMNSGDVNQNITYNGTPVPQDIKEETEAAVYNLELICPSLTFTPNEISQLVSGTTTGVALEGVSEESQVQNSVVVYDPSGTTPPQNQNASGISGNQNLSMPLDTQLLIEKSKVPESECKSSVDATLTSNDKSATVESMESLMEQNKLLNDLISQIITDKFEFQKDFLEDCQASDVKLLPGDKTSDEIYRYSDTELRKVEHPENKTVSSSPGTMVVRTPADLKNHCVWDDPLISEGPPGMEKTGVKMTTSGGNRNRVADATEAERIFSEIQNSEAGNSSQYSYMDYLSPISGEHMETTITNYILEDCNDFLNLGASKNLFDNDLDDILSHCVTPDAVLKQQKPSRRKKIKKVVEVKTKKTKTRRRSKSKDEEEIVQNYCETNEYLSSDGEAHTSFKVYCDAQTQVLDALFNAGQQGNVATQDAESQWEDCAIKNHESFETSKDAEDKNSNAVKLIHEERLHQESDEREDSIGSETHKSMFYSYRPNGAMHDHSYAVNASRNGIQNPSEHVPGIGKPSTPMDFPTLKHQESALVPVNSNVSHNALVSQELSSCEERTYSVSLIDIQRKFDLLGMDSEDTNYGTADSENIDGGNTMDSNSVSKNQSPLNFSENNNVPHNNSENGLQKENVACDTISICEIMGTLGIGKTSMTHKPTFIHETFSYKADSPKSKFSSPYIKIEKMENICAANRTKADSDSTGKTTSKVDTTVNQSTAFDSVDFQPYMRCLRPRKTSQCLDKTNNKTQLPVSPPIKKSVEGLNPVTPSKKRRKSDTALSQNNKKQKGRSKEVIPETDFLVSNASLKNSKSQNSNPYRTTPKKRRSKQEFEISFNSAENNDSSSIDSNDIKLSPTPNNLKCRTEKKKKTSRKRRFSEA